MGNWIQKPGNQINLDIAVSWETVPGNQVDLEFVPSSISDCTTTWEYRDSALIDFNFVRIHDDVPSDEVNFVFDCSTGECPQRWVARKPLSIDFTIDEEWAATDPRNVNFDFNCDTSGSVRPPVLFDGFIDAWDGAAGIADLHETFVFTALDGSTFELELNDFSDTIRPNFFDGARLSGPACAYSDSGYTIHSANGATGTSINDIQPVSFVTKAATGGRAGVNIAGAVKNLTETDEYTVSWFQTLTGSFYDNDNTNGVVHFGFFFTDDAADIIPANGDWQYWNPFSEAIRGSNPTSYHAWLPSGTTVNGNIVRRDPVDSSIYVNWTKPAGTNMYTGSSKITFILRKDPTLETAILEFYINDELIESHDFGDTFPTHVVPVWHYHNYNGYSHYVTFTNVEDSSCSDFLTTFPALGLLPFGYTGETGQFDLATTYNLPLNGYTGETAVANLSADQQLTDIQGRTGETNTVVLDTRPPAELVPLAYVGETNGISLRTESVLEPIAYVGEAVEIEVDDSPAPVMLVEAASGETAAISIAFSQALGTFTGYTGESGSLEELEELELWRVTDGTSGVAALATETTVPSDQNVGESFEFDLNIRPSEGMGLFRAYDGTNGVADLRTLVQVLLFPNRISTRTEIFCDFDSTTKFDLLNTSCCPVKESHEIIELSQQEPPDLHYHGDKTVAVVDLSTAPRFQFTFHTGENFVGVNPVYLGNLVMADGVVGDVSSIELDDVNFRLCHGNFIPDPEFTFIELESVYDEDCVADFMFTGENMTLVLQNNVDVSKSTQQVGEYMAIEFEEPWLLRGYVGEFTRISNPEFSPHFYQGERIVNFNFYEPAYDMLDGVSATITSLTTDYDVEFLEQGCLENEFVPSDEYGDPDMEKFNPVPVELDEFSHSILARCF